MDSIHEYLLKGSNAEDDGGFMSAEWLMAVSLLLFPTMLIVLSLVQVPPRKNLSQEAVNAGTRAYVQSLDQHQAPIAARAAIADAISSETGEAPDLSSDSSVQSYLVSKNIQVRFKQASGPGYCPGSEIRIEIDMPWPASFNPFNMNPGNDLFTMGTLTSSSTERIDDYSELADSETGDSTFDYDEEHDRCVP